MSTWTWGVLVLVLIAVPIVLQALRRMPGRPTHGVSLELLGQLPLGPRERVVLVRTDDHVLVLGVTQHNVSLLNQLERPAHASEATNAVPAATGFAQLLRTTLSSYTGRRS